MVEKIALAPHKTSADSPAARSFSTPAPVAREAMISSIIKAVLTKRQHERAKLEFDFDKLLLSDEENVIYADGEIGSPLSVLLRYYFETKKRTKKMPRDYSRFLSEFAKPDSLPLAVENWLSFDE